MKNIRFFETQNQSFWLHYFIRGDFYVSWQVERVIAQRESEENPDEVEYLVKWRQLPYCESTWESRSDIDDDAKV